MLIRVGSRGSRLALTQAGLASSRLRAPGIEIALVPITTAGDRDRTRPFGEIGARGVFVKELEEALLDNRVDVAVHSAKDMTSSDTDGLVVGAYLEREDPRDALIGANTLRSGMRIGTASIRRRAQLLALEPTLSIEPLRGNIDTRLRKRRERGLDAIVLAACGLDRLGLADEIGLRFEPDVMVPEAGQGANQVFGPRLSLSRSFDRDLAVADAPAAVHSQDLAGCEAGFIRKEISRGGVEIGGLAHAPAVERLLRGKELHDLGIALGALRHRRRNRPGREDIEANVCEGVIGGGGFGEADDRRFGSGVGVRGEKMGRRRKAKNGTEVENGSACLLLEKLTNGGAV